MKHWVLGVLLLSTGTAIASAQEPTALELLLPGGTLYSMSSRSYRSIRLPDSWAITAGAYSPDGQKLALVLIGTGRPRQLPSRDSRTGGPLYKTVRLWSPSTRLVLMDRRTGLVSHAWRLPAERIPTVWTLTWSNPARIDAFAHTSSSDSLGTSRWVYGFDLIHHTALKPEHAEEPAVGPARATDCPRTLAETHFQNKENRFTLEAAACSTPPENSDLYSLVRANPTTHKDTILWEYRVSADTTTCSVPYACYGSSNVQFLSAANQLYLVWDGDLYALNETADGMDVTLVAQLLPALNHPWGMAEGDTHLNPLDVVNNVTFQPVVPTLSIPHSDNPVLYVQNNSVKRGFHAAVEVGSYKKSMMVPGGYQVGPVEIGSFKDRAYTPLLITATWTAFHHLSDPVVCELPYTLLPTTSGMVVALTENERGALQCHIQTQENH